MPILEQLQPAFMAFAVLFLLVVPGFWGLRKTPQNNGGPTCWSVSYVFNGLGFLGWGLTPYIESFWAYASGDFMHMLGFLFIALGVLRFTDRRPTTRHYLAGLVAMACWAMLILVSITQTVFKVFPFFLLLRALPVAAASWWLFKDDRPQSARARRLAGWCFAAWALGMAVWPGLVFFPGLRAPSLGFMVGLHLAASLGLVLMVVDRLRTQALQAEERAERLEGLLPICAHCKKVRTPQGQWQDIEVYISQRSDADFSHGLCEECLAALYPEVAQRLAAKRANITQSG